MLRATACGIPTLHLSRTGQEPTKGLLTPRYCACRNACASKPDMATRDLAARSDHENTTCPSAFFRLARWRGAPSVARLWRGSLSFADKSVGVPLSHASFAPRWHGTSSYARKVARDVLFRAFPEDSATQSPPSAHLPCEREGPVDSSAKESPSRPRACERAPAVPRRPTADAARRALAAVLSRPGGARRGARGRG